MHVRDFGMIKKLYKQIKAKGITPNQLYLDSVLECAMRTDDADIIYDALNSKRAWRESFQEEIS